MKKKVLFAINHFRYSNGVAAALRSLIQNLDPEKYDIHLLTFYEFDPEFAAPVADKITVVPGFGFYFRGFDKIVDLIPAKWLYKKFVKEDYDLEISFQFGVPTRCLSVSENPRRLCWMHTYDTEMHQGKYYKRYPKMITVARVGRDKLIRDGFPEEGCDYCYNIIDESVILEKAEEPAALRKTKKYAVVTVARMMPDKAYYRLAECIKNIPDEEKPDAEFWFVGGGSEKEKVEQFVKENHLEEWIKVFGQQNNPYPYIKNADLYFCGSLREGFSTACQEAALLGLPVVSVCVDGAQELIEEAECGKVIENSNAAITAELRKLLSDDELISAWKQTADKNKSRFYKAARIKKADEVLREALW